MPNPPLLVLVLPLPGETEAAEATRRTLCASSAGGAVHAVVAQPGEPFGALLQREMDAHPGSDIVCVAAGIELPYAWDARLAKAAHAEPRIAAAVPLCDASPLHRLVDDALREQAAREAVAIDRTVYCIGTRAYYEAPRLHPFCAYLRGDAVAPAMAGLREAADVAPALDALAERWRGEGRPMVLCDFLYVGSAAPRTPIPVREESVDDAAFELHHPLGALRRAVTEALSRGLPPVSTPALDARPVVLHVMHFWGGGVDKWVRDFARADGARTNLILATYRIGDRGGQRVVLYSDPDAKVPVRTWDIARPIPSTVVSSLEYRAILEEIVREFDVEAIVVSSLIGHSLDALAQPVRTLVVCHDFYPVCPNINPRLDDICASCGVDGMSRCLEASEFRTVFGETTPAYWQALRDAYVSRLLEARIEMVAPSACVADTLRRLEPRLAQVPMRVIPHGIEFAPARIAAPPVEASQPLRLAVLGRLNAYKGLTLLRSAGKALGAQAEVTLVGCGRDALKLAEEMGWDAIEEYALEDLPGILESLAPHGAVLPSVVPESFSYTLSELWALGIPPLATDLGAFRERIHDGVTGFLFAPNGDALVALARDLRERPERLAAVWSNLAARGPEPTTADMVADYAALLPAGERAIARFRLGIGRESALTEPYRQLDAAYARLRAAYDELEAAYTNTSEAYVHTRSEYERAQSRNAKLQDLMRICEAYGRELESLQLGVRWWMAPKADRLVGEMRRKIMGSQQEAASPTKQDP